MKKIRTPLRWIAIGFIVYLLQKIIFGFFFNSAHFLWFKVDQILTLHSFEHVEFRSVEIFKLTCMVSELQAFIFLYF